MAIESKADLVLKNGSLYTVDPDRSWAQAVAITGGKLTYVGSDSGVDPEEILWPEEKVMLGEMIVSFTLNGAYAKFLDEETGSLEVGKQADIVVLERNLFEIPVTEIAKTEVVLTSVDGKEVHRNDEQIPRIDNHR